MSLFLAAWLAASGCQTHGRHQQLGHKTNAGRLAPALTNLGDYARPVSTQSADAQRFFTQGLILVYAFNHSEALRSFQEAARLDPSCGMMYWGQALALAPNIDHPAIGPAREQQGLEAARKALQHNIGLTPVESGLIGAIAARFGGENPDRAALNPAYAEAMRRLYGLFPDDPDVAVLYADAVMNTMPWDYWTKEGKPRPGIAEIVAALERAIRSNPDHPGAHRFYIHAVEASSDPDRGIPSAEKLGSLVPGSGHLVHMPSHIFMRVGRYGEAAEANLKAIAADEDYISQCRAQGIYPAAYHPHNLHFLFAALSMEGRGKEALAAASKAASRLQPKDLQDPASGFPHLLRSMPYFAKVRFGRWDLVLVEHDPGPSSTFVRAIWHFARGTALASTGDPGAAETELRQLRMLARAPELAVLKIFGIHPLDKLAAIAEAMLEGEIAASKREIEPAVRSLRRAVALEDGLLSSQPPGWPLPPRHILGAVLLEFGRVEEAEKCFRQDLTRHPGNGWALRGLARSLELQGKQPEAAAVTAEFRKAWAGADVRIATSRL